MPKRSKPRNVNFLPHVRYFVPAGVPGPLLDEEVLSLEEVEAIRLCDLEKLPQTVCAGKMKIAQSTFNRLVDSARTKVARCIVEGRALNIRGGNYELSGDRMRCMSCGNEWTQSAPASPGSDPPGPCPRCNGGPIAIIVNSTPRTIDGGTHRYGARGK